MTLEELQEKAYQLAVSDRLTLISSVIQSLQQVSQIEAWQYLVSRPHPWRQQLYIKGHKLLASTVWRDMITNHLLPKQENSEYVLRNPFVVLNQWRY